MRQIESRFATYRVAFQPRPSRIPVNEYFTMSVAVHDAQGAGVDVELAVDADMPEHGHGLVARPRVRRTESGRFEVEGLLLHMPGLWELYFDVTREGATERAVAAVQVE